MTRPHYLTRTECDVSALLADLATVPTLTDMPTTIAHARSLAVKVRLFADTPGMLGDNGYGPAIASCIANARAHGFDWRDIPAQVDRIHAIAAGRIPEMPLITTRAVKLNPDLWPDLEEA